MQQTARVNGARHLSLGSRMLPARPAFLGAVDPPRPRAAAGASSSSSSRVGLQRAKRGIGLSMAQAFALGSAACHPFAAMGSTRAARAPLVAASSMATTTEAAKAGDGGAAARFNVLDVLKERGLLNDATNEAGLAKELAAGGKTMTVYCGFDPTADSLHLGNLLGIIVLTWFVRVSTTARHSTAQHSRI